MCACARNVHIPPTPTSILRSIQHVCKCKERSHPPHPNPASCVASNMCASARNVNIPPTPTQKLTYAHGLLRHVAPKTNQRPSSHCSKRWFNILHHITATLLYPKPKRVRIVLKAARLWLLKKGSVSNPNTAAITPILGSCPPCIHNEEM